MTAAQCKPMVKHGIMRRMGSKHCSRPMRDRESAGVVFASRPGLELRNEPSTSSEEAAVSRF
jgi:hypothetical protein